MNPCPYDPTSLDDENLIFNNSDYTVDDKIKKYNELIEHFSEFIKGIDGLISYYDSHLTKERKSRKRDKSPDGSDITSLVESGYDINCPDRINLNKIKIASLKKKKDMYYHATFAYKEKIDDLLKVVGKDHPDKNKEVITDDNTETQPKVIPTFERSPSLFEQQNVNPGSPSISLTTNTTVDQKPSASNQTHQDWEDDDKSKKGKKWDPDFNSKNPVKDLLLCVTNLANQMEGVIMNVGYIKDKVDELSTRLSNCESILDSIIASKGIAGKALHTVPATPLVQDLPMSHGSTITRDPPKPAFYPGASSTF